MKTIAASLLAIGLCLPAVAQDLPGDPEKGERVFRKCMACHAVGDDARNKVGPELNGILGRTTAAVEDFSYSDAMAEKGAEGHVWTAEELDAYLADPKGFIPGNKMAFPGLRKPQERADVIAYLAGFE
ncbi:c-type cytochrome [Mangrovicoccus algicola]|uniref:Cytochrome c family protein n=1 Tax=Mangrovicoccus algicola TaxID=2771008 RepID=A0A8J6YSK6_9RHOB|nr:cytochrome c family protein [Mangrovicoccus algicola]MBE3636992.1 cytochrome c family protein [Mangrovicoccus algicola]